MPSESSAWSSPSVARDSAACARTDGARSFVNARSRNVPGDRTGTNAIIHAPISRSEALLCVTRSAATRSPSGDRRVTTLVAASHATESAAVASQSSCGASFRNWRSPATLSAQIAAARTRRGLDKSTVTARNFSTSDVKPDTNRRFNSAAPRTACGRVPMNARSCVSTVAFIGDKKEFPKSDIDCRVTSLYAPNMITGRRHRESRECSHL